MKHKLKLLSIGAIAGVALAAQLSTVIGQDYDETTDGSYDDEAYGDIYYDDETYGDDTSYYDDDEGNPYVEPCSLFVDYDNDDVILLAYAAPGSSGTWRMTLTQRGPSGSSDVSQSGSIRPDGALPIALSEMVVNASGGFTATLTTSTQAGTHRCTVSS